MSVDSGPLGFAAAIMTGVGTKSPHTFLLHSADGVTWDVTDLGKVGAPARSYGALLLDPWVGCGVGPRVHPARFLGSELSNDSNRGGKAGCGTRAYGSARVD